MVLGPLGKPYEQTRLHPGFVIGFDPSTRQIVNSYLLAGAARKSLLLFKPLCPKTRSVPEESNGLSSSGWWCNNHLEKLKYESQWEGLSHILWKIKFMFETTNQSLFHISFRKKSISCEMYLWYLSRYLGVQFHKL